MKLFTKLYNALKLYGLLVEKCHNLLKCFECKILYMKLIIFNCQDKE